MQLPGKMFHRLEKRSYFSISLADKATGFSMSFHKGLLLTDLSYLPALPQLSSSPFYIRIPVFLIISSLL